jgi:hypothetical protein
MPTAGESGYETASATDLSCLFGVEDGRARPAREYGDDSCRVLEVLEPNAAGVSLAQSMGAVVDASIVNQGFVRGHGDEQHLELVSDRSPVVRMYRVQGASSALRAAEEPG